MGQGTEAEAFVRGVCVTWSAAAHRELGSDGQVGLFEDELSRWSFTVVDMATKTLVGSSHVSVLTVKTAKLLKE